MSSDPRVTDCFDIAVVLAHPVLIDLVRLVQGRGRWEQATIRSALAVLATIAPDRASALAVFSTWCASFTSSTMPAPAGELVEAAADRLLACRNRQPAPAVIARSCRVSGKEATAFGLAVVRPAPRQRLASATRKRAGRIRSGVLPRLIDIMAAQPWKLVGKTRSRWYERVPDPAERQIEALRALVSRGDREAVNAVRRQVLDVLKAHKPGDAARRRSVDHLLDRVCEAIYEFDERIGNTKLMPFEVTSCLVQFASWGSVTLEHVEATAPGYKTM